MNQVAQILWRGKFLGLDYSAKTWHSDIEHYAYCLCHKEIHGPMLLISIPDAYQGAVNFGRSQAMVCTECIRSSDYIQWGTSHSEFERLLAQALSENDQVLKGVYYEAGK